MAASELGGVRELADIADFRSERGGSGPGRRTTRKMTEKGQLYIESTKLKNLKLSLKKLEGKINDLEITWLDLDSELLRKERHELENLRNVLLNTKTDFTKTSIKNLHNELIKACDSQNEQALELRKKIGERIFELEKEESRSSKRSIKSSSTHKSLQRVKFELSKSEIEMKFLRLQAEHELELQRKRFEFEQLQRLKNHEIMKAEKDALEECEVKSTMLTEENLEQIETQVEEERIRNYIQSISHAEQSRNPSVTCNEKNDSANHVTLNARSNARDNSIDYANLGNGNACAGSQSKHSQRDHSNRTTLLNTGSPPFVPDNRPVRNTGSPPFVPDNRPVLNTGSPPFVPDNRPVRNTGSPPFVPDNRPVLNTGSPPFVPDNRPVLNTGSPPFVPDNRPVLNTGNENTLATDNPEFPRPVSNAGTQFNHPERYLVSSLPSQPSRIYKDPIQMSTPQTLTSQIHTFQSAQDIGLSIAEGIQASRLPSPKLNIFTGNPLEWPTWKTAFQTVIERRTSSDSERILYLQQYLAGEPKKIVEGYQFVPSASAYQEAMKTLERRFGNPSVVADAFREKLANWPRISPKDGKELRDYADFLKTCELAMHSVEDLESLNKQHENKQLLKTLPSWMHPKWGAKVRDFQLIHGESKFPPFSMFVEFVSSTADVQCLPVLLGLDIGKPQRPGVGKFKNSHSRNTASTLATRVQHKNVECLWCKASHHLNACTEFLKKGIKDRTKFIIRKGLCLRCLRHGHMAKENKCSETVACSKCKQQHPTCLHVDNADEGQPKQATNAEKESETAATKCTNVCKLDGQQGGQDQCLVVPVWISSVANPQNERLTYALLDCQSNATFITEDLRSALNVDGVDTHLLLSTMHQENEFIECKKIQGLTIRDFKNTISIAMPSTFTRQNIPCKPSQIPKPSVARQWKHLEGIADELMPFRDDIGVGLLIGTNCAKAIKPRQIIPGSDDDPYGVRTDLGWGIVGRVCKSPLNEESTVTTEAYKTNRTAVDLVSSNQRHIERNDANKVAFTIETHTREVISPAEVRAMFERDFHEKCDPKQQSLSVDDRRFLTKLENGIHKREDGHYEMPLPLRFTDVALPNNKSQALRRLAQLKSRFKRDPKFQKDYAAFMEKTLANCAEKVPKDGGLEGRINYVAHHGVYHPKKPGKIRVVFDCSANFGGTSLNKHLLQGPDLTNNLLGVLSRFRKEPVALACDVEGMFHQFFVNEADRDLLRFFWWEDGNIDNYPTEYRMKVHLFGAASSPGCANFGFKKAADDAEAEFGRAAADFIRRDFYVDDGLKSVESPDEAIALIKNSQDICAKAGLRLHKFSSNCPEVIKAIPTEDRAQSLQQIDFTSDPLPIERTLGIMWCIETDTFQFRVVVQDRPLTRRGILSTVCSVFDPLGFVAPIVLVGKQILQELCRLNVEWDEPIDDHLRPKWEQWRKNLRDLEQLRIPRCYKPNDFGKAKRVELHHFSDASEVGYGQCSYLRLLNENNQAHCTLVMAKARVTPLKSITIPRLELTAATISVKINQWLLKELEYPEVTEVFWTDSQVVLGYINNQSKRFHTFVANRVQQIHDHTQPNQWQYVDTSNNPADLASRGASTLADKKEWFNGPAFLWNPGPYQVQQTDQAMELNSEDPEVKKATTMSTQITSNVSPTSYIESSIFDRFSNWFTAKKVVAYCLRFKSLLLNKLATNSTKKTPHGPVSLDELHQAELVILRSVQREHFNAETEVLRSQNVKGEFVSRDEAKRRNVSLRKCSSLYRVDPYIDDDGLLRVGGRLRKASITEKQKHPVILPRRAHLTNMIVRHFHAVTKHQGRGMTLNEVRQQGFWVIGGTAATSEVINKCVTCKKLRGPLQQQKMADLPADRIEPAPPFTYCGVDCFGPFPIKEGRKELKRYGVLFTCMASRAIHIETAAFLSTDSFINALRRFLAERGPTRQIRSDCGTNFVGARNELKEALDEDKIRTMLMKEGCEFNFKMNPPSASHAGGVWERQIRSARNVLNPLLLESGHQLDDESLRTLLKEVQAIVNSRPLTSTNSHEMEPLTPNHLLTMKSKVLMPPPGVFQEADLYCRKRWRRVQHLANEFWKRWRREYLQTLQVRPKWNKTSRNLQAGDIVIIKDDNAPRCEWKLARVLEPLPSDDGLVRKVRLAVATAHLDSKGKREKDFTVMERPVQKLVLLQHAE